MIDAMRKMMAPLARRIVAIAARATITAIDDSGQLQLVQVSALAGERLSGVQRLQMFGFSGVPQVGSSGLLICINGSRTHPLFVAGEDGTRKAGLQPGESAQHNAFGDYVYIQKDGTVYVKSSLKTYVDAPDTETTGNLKVGGNLVVMGTSTLTQDVSCAADLAIAGATAGVGTGIFQAGIADAKGSMETFRTDYNGHAHTGGNGSAGLTGVTNMPVPT